MAQQDESAHRAILEALGEVILVHAPGGPFVEATRAACERLGWSREELLRLTPSDVLSPGERLRLDRWVGYALEQGRCCTETALISREGRVIPAHLEAIRCDFNGRPSIISIWRDDPPSGLSAHQFRLARREFERFMDHLPAAAFIKDAEGRTLYFNRFLREILGANDSWLGKRTDELWPGPIGQAMRDDDREAIQRGFKEKEETVPCVDGVVREYYTKKFAIPRGEEPPMVGGISIDITERKAARRALAASEAKLRAIFDGAGDGIALVDPATRRFVVANQRFADMFGYTREEILRLRVEDIHPPEISALIIEEFDAHVLGTRSRSNELPALRKDGSIIFVSVTSNPVALPDGMLQLDILRDITEQKAAREALQQSEAKFRALLDNASDGIAAADPKTMRFVMANQRFAQMLGYSVDEFLRLSVPDIHPPEDIEGIVRTFDRHLREGRLLTREIRMRRKDGSIFLAEISTANVVLHDGLVMLGILRDMTEQKDAEEAIRSSEARFRVMFENAPFGVVLVDDSGHPVLVNRAFEEMLGYSADHLKTMAFADFTHPDDARAEWRQFEELIRGQSESYRMEKRYIRADGRIIWASLGVAVARDQSGRPRHVIGMIEDITERKRIEQELKDIQAKMLQTQKLESLGVLAGGIAHDFNNLLMAIVGHAEFFLEEMPKDSNLLAAAREIEIASRRGAELCRQMLAYAGRAKPAIEATDVNGIVQEMSRLLEASIPKAAEVRYGLAKDLPAARVDATQMRQIVMNLVVNASEALADGNGTIAITTGVRRCDRAFLAGTYVDDGLAGGDYVFLEVADTGCGMDEATMARVFDPFFTTKFAGRGLGLASVLGIIRGNAGAIRVQSEPAKGSTFTVLFPAQLAAAAAGIPAITSANEWRGSGMVLVIDDETGVRSVTARHLEKSGFEVLTAESGPRGLELLGEHPEVGLVILDLAMPQMGGDVCFMRIRDLRPDLPIIMTSGYDESGVTERMPGAPISGFLQKPFKRWELLAMTRRILGDECVRCEK